jgi:hypothetical protein
MRSVEGGGEASKRMSRTLELGEGALWRYLNATSKWKLARRLSFVSRLFAGQLTTKKRLGSRGRKPFDLNRRCPGSARVGQYVKRAGKIRIASLTRGCGGAAVPRVELQLLQL